MDEDTRVTNREVENAVEIPQDAGQNLGMEKLSEVSDEIEKMLLQKHKINATGMISVGLNLICFAIGNSDISAEDIRYVVDKTITQALDLRSREDGTS